MAKKKKAKTALDEALPSPTVSVSAANRLPIRNAITAFLAKMEVENGRFLRVAIDAYRDELEVQLRKSGQATGDSD